MARAGDPGGARWFASAPARHALAAGTSLALVLLLGPGLGRGFPPRHWNPVLGRASLVLIGATLTIGPLARIAPRLRGLLSIRRELGAWSAILAVVHVGLVLHEWAGWRLAPLWERFDGATFSADSGLALANLAGTLALGYALVLLATSNDAAQRRLGPRWKAIQRGATTLFILAVLHTAFFVYLDTFPRGGFHDLTGSYASFTWVVIWLVAIVTLVRAVGFWASGPEPPEP